jgi:GxxExxY protein
MEKIILEAKAVECLTDSHVKQTLNYLAAAKLRLGLLVNFGEDSLSYKRVVL